jgi:flagellar biosynthetic protein FliR
VENLYTFNFSHILGFALLFLRMVGFCVSAPIIGTNNVPAPVKVLFSLVLSSILFPQMSWNKLSVDLESLLIVSMAAKEVFVGLVFGFLARIFFMTVTMAGHIISVSLGLSTSQLFNPALGDTSTAFDQFFGILSVLFFFAINGHYSLIVGLFGTFQIIPVQEMGINFEAFQGIAPLVQHATALAIKMSAPIMASILIMNLSIAVIGRAVPQINILVTSLPVNILVGLLVVFISLPLLVWQMKELMTVMDLRVFEILKSM